MIKIKIEVIYKNKNYNLIDRDKDKVEQLTKREKVKTPVIGITILATLSFYAYKTLQVLYDLIAAL